MRCLFVIRMNLFIYITILNLLDSEHTSAMRFFFFLFLSFFLTNCTMLNLNARENHHTTSLNCALSVFPGGLFKRIPMSSVFPSTAIAVIERVRRRKERKGGVERDDGKRDGPCSSFAVSIPRKLKVDCTSGPAGSYEKALVKTSLIPLSSTPSLLAPVRGLRILPSSSLYLRFAHSVSITTGFIAADVRCSAERSFLPALRWTRVYNYE